MEDQYNGLYGRTLSLSARCKTSMRVLVFKAAVELTPPLAPIKLATLGDRARVVMSERSQASGRVSGVSLADCRLVGMEGRHNQCCPGRGGSAPPAGVPLGAFRTVLPPLTPDGADLGPFARACLCEGLIEQAKLCCMERKDEDAGQDALELDLVDSAKLGPARWV